MAVLSTLQDLFNQTTLNTGLWTQFTAGSATFTYAASGAQVNYPSSSTSSTDGDIASVSAYDLTSSSASLHVITVPSSATSADAELRVYDSTQANNSINWLHMLYEGGTLFAQKRVSSSTSTLATATYNATTHAYWRIRESGGTCFFDYSSDASTWTNFASVANPFTITSMKVLIAATCFQNESNPGTFKWNNFNLLPLTLRRPLLGVGL